MEPLASVGNDSIFSIEMRVDEVKIVKLKMGQKALITLDAYRLEVFTARIRKIYPRKDERSQTFKVESLFDSPPEILYPGLAGEGNIVIAEKENALTIPKTYLFEENKVMTTDGVVELFDDVKDITESILVDLIKGCVMVHYKYPKLKKNRPFLHDIPHATLIFKGLPCYSNLNPMDK